MAEKKRRSDMNDAIERLRALLPQQVTAEKRLTKVEVLLEAADHLTQVQNLCAKLIAENNGLMAKSAAVSAGGAVMQGGGGDEGRRQIEGPRRGDEEDEEESEEDDGDGDEDEFRRKAQQQGDENGRMANRKDVPVQGGYPQHMVHHNRNGHGSGAPQMLGDKVGEDMGGVGITGGRSVEQQQPPQQGIPQKPRDRP